VTLKTEVMMLKIQLCHHSYILKTSTPNYILKYIQINCNNNSQYNCIFDQINTALVRKKHFKKNLTNPKLWNNGIVHFTKIKMTGNSFSNILKVNENWGCQAPNQQNRNIIKEL